MRCFFMNGLQCRPFFFRPAKQFSENLAKTPCSDCSMGRGKIRGYERGARKRQAMQSGTHFAKTGGFRLHGARLFHACWGAAPIPAEHKIVVLERRINPAAARFCKSLVGGQLNAAPPLFPVVHSLPPAPCPAPEYGRYWPWPSAALSFPRGLFGSRRRPLSSPPAARRTRYSAP